MAIRKRKVGNSTYLEEYRSFRVNGKVKSKRLGGENKEKIKRKNK